MTETRGQLPRRTAREAALAAAAAASARLPERMAADRRWTGWLIWILIVVEIAANINTLVADLSDPASPAEFSPWLTIAVVFTISVLLYLLAWKGFRFAWWLIFIRIGVNLVVIGINQSIYLDWVSLVFALVFATLGGILLFTRRVAAFRSDSRRTFRRRRS